MARFRFPYILTLSLSTLALGAVGCSNGSSPTEPAFDSLEAPVVAASSSTDSSVVSDNGEKRRGGDDSADDNNNNRRRRGRGNGGNGNDDPAGDDRGGRRGGRGGNDDNPRPAGTSEFEARVLSVSGSTLSLAGGTRVTVNGATQWSARGDLFNLSQVSAAVAANRPVRAEGRGTRQADGSFVAQTLKVEVDD
jgi:hypothetical protein